GTSTARVLACRDYTGLEIMRVLKDAVSAGSTHFLERHALMELCDDGQGQVTGAVLWNTETHAWVTVSARAVLLATGGCGQLRFQRYPTSNHLGATGDGLVAAYRQGCRLIHLDSFQFHPSGACFPEALAGQLVTESIRAIGAHLLNREGGRFVDELAYRDVVAAAIIREVKEGRGVATPAGREGVWLDTPMIERLRGEGTLARQFPGLVHRFGRFGLDPARLPVLVYPTLHYQNGGVEIDTEGRTGVRGLWAAGEVTGGLHGTNRLMGNSLLDIIVFGRRAGASILSHLPARGPVTLHQLGRLREERRRLAKAPEGTAPRLFPEESGIRFEPPGAGPAQSPGTEETAAPKKSFEPPDPFAGG
ncbi:MAG: FAD-binding protein, partial [Nitrospinaceae bacterium]